ncbi:NO-inducible flavohemoprotein [Pseudoalteromonas luteoviolacea]|uniref:NO-inducible flavohemoprotein n=1 Tax=Pseudoalteromonas luteoviolacea TaxID=43657 RepID=UPI001B39BBFF|nr:NO-inducible flavohemoprotein [Pseudoalteromonas luteoviolacea]MBQ4837316.1 NO-inducible flavohemoprotein [Pseudoalteromonas luteoviolacea]
MLSTQTIKLVKDTIPLLANAGPAVTDHFYKRMFSHNPELLDIFNISNQKSGKQQFALFSALAAYATHIDNPAVLAHAIDRINHKHASLNILPEHYPIVGTHLLATLQEMFPNECTPEIIDAWAEAYGFLADLFITQEEGIYQNNENKTGGWRGRRRFTISKIVKESEVIKSFYLAPSDERPVASYQAGQYLAVDCKVNGSDNRQIRQYSLSQSSQPDHYRISVKTDGLVSGYLHTLNEGDEIDAYPPAGDFVLQNTPAPKVFISAGVGITPMMAMLETTKLHSAETPCWFLHAARTHTEHAFYDVVESYKDQMPSLRSHYWIEKDANTHTQGLMQLAPLETQLPLQQGEFYLCGPSAFMSFVKQQLLELGVQDSQIFYEVFGPHQDV